MGLPKTFVDGYLVDWGHALFYEESMRPKQKGRTKIQNPERKWGAAAGRALMRGKQALASAARVRAQIERTANKAPEVMVKITSKKDAGRGMARIRAHLDYITRNGKLEIETDEQERLHGKQPLRDLQADWTMNPNGTAIPDESHRREAFNVIFSMAAGTPAEDVRQAVRTFLAQEFGGKHRYAFVLHTDQAHPHVHVCIQAAPKYRGHRLNPRKADLERWREGFAEALRDQGLAANATPRKTRAMVGREPLKQERYHLNRKRGVTPPSPKPLTRQVIHAYHQQGRAWNGIVDALKQSEDAADQRLASKVEQFMKVTPLAQIPLAKQPGVIKRNEKQRKNDERHQTRLQKRIIGSNLSAALHQPDRQTNDGRAKAARNTGVRKLSGRNVAPNRRAEVLLQPNAPHRLGKRR